MVVVGPGRALPGLTAPPRRPWGRTVGGRSSLGPPPISHLTHLMSAPDREIPRRGAPSSAVRGSGGSDDARAAAGAGLRGRHGGHARRECRSKRHWPPSGRHGLAGDGSGPGRRHARGYRGKNQPDGFQLTVLSDSTGGTGGRTLSISAPLEGSPGGREFNRAGRVRILPCTLQGRAKSLKQCMSA